MTEDEAKTKWCPMVRFVAVDERSQNTHRCIGSDCMMWRARYPEGTSQSEAVEWGGTIEKTDGYCGLGGRP